MTDTLMTELSINLPTILYKFNEIKFLILWYCVETDTETYKK